MVVAVVAGAGSGGGHLCSCRDCVAGCFTAVLCLVTHHLRVGGGRGGPWGIAAANGFRPSASPTFVSQPTVVSSTSVVWPPGHSEDNLAFGYVMVRSQ